MKKTILVLLIALGFMISFSVSSMAACSDNVCKGKITQLRLHDNILYIGTDGDESQLNCTSPAGVYVSIPTSDPYFNQKYSLLLTTVSLDKTVIIRIKALSRNCAVSSIIMPNP